jgi:hypothetical protein
MMFDSTVLQNSFNLNLTTTHQPAVGDRSAQNGRAADVS